jgi:tocopherol O-methyltransferase
VTGITISGKQVEIAKRLTLADSPASPPTESKDTTDFLPFPPGQVRFLELDAEDMLPFFNTQQPSHLQFSCIWISEALSHFPNKANFFSSAFSLLTPNTSSRLVIADWFRAPDVTPEQEATDIKSIEDGMLLPRLYTIPEYIDLATEAGFKLKDGGGPFDISKDVAKTWYNPHQVSF